MLIILYLCLKVFPRGRLFFAGIHPQRVWDHIETIVRAGKERFGIRVILLVMGALILADLGNTVTEFAGLFRRKKTQKYAWMRKTALWKEMNKDGEEW